MRLSGDRKRGGLDPTSGENSYNVIDKLPTNNCNHHNLADTRTPSVCQHDLHSGSTLFTLVKILQKRGAADALLSGHLHQVGEYSSRPTRSASSLSLSTS